MRLHRSGWLCGTGGWHRLALGPHPDRGGAVHAAGCGRRAGGAREPHRRQPHRDCGSRGLDRSLVTALAGCDWLRHGRCVLITGATGVGKTWLACALAQQAARSGFTVLYMRAPRLLEELRVAHGDGSFGRRLAQLARIDLLAIDDFAIAPVTAAERNDLRELLDDRVGTRATLITSQLPVSAWHEWLNDPTLADAILDRIVHAAHKIALKGESMRRKQVMP
ncbi:ATP-binding protein [Variovorax paradoxus]|nr:ATP-binding protein [Variovorax paradoxus]